MLKTNLFILLIATFHLNGGPFRSVPFLTEEAIAFLEVFLEENPEAHVLEFGSGASTVWIAKRTPNLISIEHDPKWYTLVQNKLQNPVDLRLCKRPYYDQCETINPETLDLVIVDGRNRKGCIIHSIPLLKSGGVLMVDNAEREYYFPAYSLLEGWETVITEQKKPDSHGYFHKGWVTRWWFKP